MLTKRIANNVHWTLSSVSSNCPVTMIVMIFSSQMSMSQRSPVSKIALWKCSRHVFDFVFVFDFLFVFLLVGPCLLITLIKCLGLWYIEQIYGEPSLELLRCQEGFLHCALALRELYCVYVGVALQGHVWGLPLTESSRVENWDWCGIMADSKNNVGGKMYPHMLRTPEGCWRDEHHH